jgi:hypothetical protein
MYGLIDRCTLTHQGVADLVAQFGEQFARSDNGIRFSSHTRYLISR